jgi:CRISPR/Cas system-associated exonuclease Cas4 (RecB family)
LFFDWKYAPKKFTEDESIFDVGNAMHEIATDYLKRQGIWWGDENRMGDKELNLSCRIDNLIEHKGKIVPVEVKTIKKWMTQIHRNSVIKSIKEEPKDNHILQVQAYLMCKWLSDDREIEFRFPYGLIWYIERDDPKLIKPVALWKIYPDEELWKNLRQQIETVNVALENDEAPERCRESSNEYPCSWCQYREHCWSEDD